LVFIFSNGTCEDYIAFLIERFEQTPQLFQGSKVIFQGAGLDNLNNVEICELQKLCLEHGMILNNMAAPEMSLEKSYNQPNLIYYRNIRSGQKITAEGSVIIWGDVHESAEILAGGDIIVLGSLHGIAHAGCYGDLNKIVFALNLNPSQIRIGNKISRAAEKKGNRSYPEIAYWDGNNICISVYDAKEAWLTR
jgi:septum site-determining protein MinC